MHKKFISISLLSSLIACSSIDSNRIAPGYVEAFKSIQGLLLSPENKDLTPQLVQKIPYATLILKIGKGAPGLLILESKKRERTYWVSADGVFILIEEGRIIQTAGMENNLKRYVSNYSLTHSLKNLDTSNVINYYSFNRPILNNLKVKSNFKKVGMEQVTILSKTRNLTLYEETINNEYLGWSRVNKYWVDKENYVWKSRQYISPKLPPFYIEVTKKPT